MIKLLIMQFSLILFYSSSLGQHFVVRHFQYLSFEVFIDLPVDSQVLCE